MKTGKRTLAVCTVAALVGAAHGQQLTGIVWYTTNLSKQYTGGYGNTYGGDTYSRNLYVTVNQQIGQGPLVNSQNLTTLPTRVQIDLSTPGTYTFQVYCNDESTVSNPYWGLNLFFEGDDVHPGISVWNVVDSPGFQTINPIGTPTLDPRTMGLVQTGNSNPPPVYTFGDTKLTLSAYNTWSIHHYNVDRVDNFSDVGGNGNGTKDDVIEFTITSSPVPEPGSLMVLGAAVLATTRRLKKRRS